VSAKELAQDILHVLKLHALVLYEFERVREIVQGDGEGALLLLVFRPSIRELVVAHDRIPNVNQTTYASGAVDRPCGPPRLPDDHRG
jgi:hypothetical protein